MRFIDFEELPLLIELCFNPLQVLMCENYIACMNKDTVHLFKILENDKKENNEMNDSMENDFNFICKLIRKFN